MIVMSVGANLALLLEPTLAQGSEGEGASDG